MVLSKLISLFGDDLTQSKKRVLVDLEEPNLKLNLFIAKKANTYMYKRSGHERNVPIDLIFLAYIEGYNSSNEGKM